MSEDNDSTAEVAGIIRPSKTNIKVIVGKQV